MEATPAANDLPLRIADFSTLAEALDYAARGKTGYNFYTGSVKLYASLSYEELREDARALARRLIDLGAVAVIRMADSAKLAKVAEAIHAGGVSAIEITMTKAGPAPDDDGDDAEDSEGISPVWAYASWGVGAVGLTQRMRSISALLLVGRRRVPDLRGEAPADLVRRVRRGDVELKHANRVRPPRAGVRLRLWRTRARAGVVVDPEVLCHRRVLCRSARVGKSPVGCCWKTKSSA